MYCFRVPQNTDVEADTEIIHPALCLDWIFLELHLQKESFASSDGFIGVKWWLKQAKRAISEVYPMYNSIVSTVEKTIDLMERKVIVIGHFS